MIKHEIATFAAKCHKIELSMMPLCEANHYLFMIDYKKYQDRFTAQYKSTFCRACASVAAHIYFTVFYKTCLMCLQDHPIMTLLLCPTSRRPETYLRRNRKMSSRGS